MTRSWSATRAGRSTRPGAGRRCARWSRRRSGTRRPLAESTLRRPSLTVKDLPLELVRVDQVVVDDGQGAHPGRGGEGRRAEPTGSDVRSTRAFAKRRWPSSPTPGRSRCRACRVRSAPTAPGRGQRVRIAAYAPPYGRRMTASRAPSPEGHHDQFAHPRPSGCHAPSAERNSSTLHNRSSWPGGYHGSDGRIADRAGVSKPVLYQHFPGKLGSTSRSWTSTATPSSAWSARPWPSPPPTTTIG